MKKILILTALLLNQIVYCQDSTKTLLLGICAHASYNHMGGPNIHPSIVANYGKSTYFIGPFLAARIDPAQKGYLPGLQLGYQIFPNGRGKVFSFFFEYDLNLLSAKIKSPETNFYINNNKYFGRRTIEFFFLDHYLSYGFNVHFLKCLYFSTSVGLGAGWSREEFIWKANTGETFRWGDKNPRLGFFKPILKAGFGCNFWKVKKQKHKVG